MLKIGDPAPAFSLASDDGHIVSSGSLKGQRYVLYFYPKDDTPGCTVEACEFRDSYDVFRERGAEILGVSPDDVASHGKFKSKYELPFTLLSDPDHHVATRYGAWAEKTNYGKTYMGIVRSSYLIDPDGKIARAWPKVKADGHAAAVLEALEEARAARTA